MLRWLPAYSSAKLNTFNEAIRGFDGIKIKDNGFNTSPRYTYQHNKRIKIGYRGDIRYTVSAKDAKKMKSFLKNILLRKEKTLEISISSRRWDTNAASREKTKEHLYIKAIKWAKNYASSLHDETGDKCKLKLFNFISKHSYSPYRSVSFAAQEDGVPVAKKQKQNILINADIKFECK